VSADPRIPGEPELRPAAASAQEPDDELRDPSLYANRELSWLDFNDRVLQLVEADGMPLLERVRLAAIFSSNLDEFFMIRVAGLHDQVDAGVATRRPDGLTPDETIDRIAARVRELGERHAGCVRDTLLPALAEHGVRVLSCAELPEAHGPELADRFHRQILPALTPLAVGPARPFPYISNLSLSLAVLLRDPPSGQTTFARVKVPKEILGRFVSLGNGEKLLVALEDVIAANLDALFPGMEILHHAAFRVTRDADFEVSDEADDLLEAVETELRQRRLGEVVRLEVAHDMHPALREQLVDALDLEHRQVYEVAGLLDQRDLADLVGSDGLDALRFEPWQPVTPARLQSEDGTECDMFAVLRTGDLLVHHPYDSFSATVERFVAQAVADPDVLAIKQTVYRTSDDSPLVPALIAATEQGKQAVCLVELTARFEERTNIQWARTLEQAGVHVTYGIPGLKTHAKALLVVRREGDGVRHYVHIGTGNYNSRTARLYTDLGLFTADERIGADVAEMFNFLTGYSRPRFDKVLVAPFGARDGIMREIELTVAAHEAGEHARIAMKMNSLVDDRCIRALYRASRAGVPVDLNVRGICCLRPGVQGVSETIRVVSVLGRFLEHSRLYAFERGKERTVWIGSADLMPRNLDDRVELLAPIEDPALRHQALALLERSLSDDAGAWDLGADGGWRRRTPGTAVRDVQAELMASHAAGAARPARSADSAAPSSPALDSRWGRWSRWLR